MRVGATSPMTTSQFHIGLRQGDGAEQSVTGSLRAVGDVQWLSVPLVAGERTTVRLVASPGVELELRWGMRVLAVLAQERGEAEIDITPELRDCDGEIVLDVIPRRSGEDAEGAVEALLSLRVAIDGSPVTRALREALIQELGEIHLGLAHDILGGSARRLGWSGKPQLFDPEAEHQRLEEALRRLQAALVVIGAQPSSALERVRRRGRWRPGDRLDLSATQSLVRDEQLVLVGGRILALGVIETRGTRITLDLPEHRHLRSGLLQLARRARRLELACRRAGALLSTEESRWGGGGPERESVFTQRYAPRVRRFEKWAQRSAEIAGRFRRLADTYPFLAEVGEPRTPLGPTPLFLERGGYREAYSALRAAAAERGLAVDTGELRIRLRDLDTLYEYWTFVRVVKLLRTRLGAPLHRQDLRLVDDVFRPDLEPGQVLCWELPGGTRVSLAYEPSIPPRRARAAAPFDFVATLVTAPLRPDLLLVVESPGGAAPRALALDAKNTTSFTRDRLWQSSDYRTLIHHRPTGTQPVRWMFFLHRTERADLCTHPDFFADPTPPPPYATLLGAVPFTPTRTDLVASILDRFLSGAGIGA